MEGGITKEGTRVSRSLGPTTSTLAALDQSACGSTDGESPGHMGILPASTSGDSPGWMGSLPAKWGVSRPAVEPIQQEAIFHAISPSPEASFVKEVRVKAYTVILRSPCIASRENPQLMQEGWLIGGQPGQEKTTFWKGAGKCMF